MRIEHEAVGRVELSEAQHCAPFEESLGLDPLKERVSTQPTDIGS